MALHQAFKLVCVGLRFYTFSPALLRATFFFFFFFWPVSIVDQAGSFQSHYISQKISHSVMSFIVIIILMIITFINAIIRNC